MTPDPAQPRGDYEALTALSLQKEREAEDVRWAMKEEIRHRFRRYYALREEAARLREAALAALADEREFRRLERGW